VTQITEVQGMEGDIVTLSDVFVFDYAAGRDEHGRYLGHAVPTGLRPRFAERLLDVGIELPAAIFAGPAAGPRSPR
jgi:pilus assembly protein CpaF